MTANQMIDLMNAKPFRAFEIHLADGEKISIEAPYEIATRKNSPSAVVYDADNTAHIISYRNVTQVVVSPGTQAGST